LRVATVVLFPAGASCIPLDQSVDAPVRTTGVQLPVYDDPTPNDRESEAAPGAREEDADRDDPAIVLVVLDGVRWQEVFGGVDRKLAAWEHIPATSADDLMPQLHAAAIERGAALGAPDHGPSMSATGPNFVSLPGYTEIFTGRTAQRCQNNECRGATAPTFTDEVRATLPDDGDVAVFSSWERIARVASVDPAKIVLSTGRSRLSHAERFLGDESARSWQELGAHASAFPGKGDFRPDRYTAELALRYLESRRPRFMFLGLGEPDEYAHRGNYAGYVASIHAADTVIGRLFETLDRMGARGANTTVFITTDHGRGHDYRFHGRGYPESGRVWLVAAGHGVRARGMVRARHSHRLADLAPTMRALLHQAPDDAPSSGALIDELLAEAPEEYAAKP
jgi:hypothetical protein